MMNKCDSLTSSTLLRNGATLALVAFIASCAPQTDSGVIDAERLLSDTQYNAPELQKARKTIFKRSKSNASEQKLGEAYRQFARSFYDKYEFYDDNSIQLLQQASLFGDHKARFYLGEYYGKRGEYTKAVHWLRPAKDYYVPAKALLGTIYEYLKQDTGEQLIEDAILHYHAEIAKGNDEYHVLIAQLYNNQNSPYYNGQRAFEHLIAALKHDPQDSYALQMLAEIYREGRVVPRDTDKALQYTKSLAESGNIYAMSLMADAFEQGGWYDERPHEALYWQYKYVNSKHQNHYMFSDYAKLAGYYAAGYGTAQNLDSAEYYYDEALKLRPGQAYKVAAQLERLKSPHAHALAKKYRAMAAR